VALLTLLKVAFIWRIGGIPALSRDEAYRPPLKDRCKGREALYAVSQTHPSLPFNKLRGGGRPANLAQGGFTED
jgi:hypothetical protein